MKHKRNLLIGLTLTAAATFVALQNVSAPTQEETASPPPITITAEPEQVEPETPAWQGCAYNWAYQALPELTEKLDAAVKELDSRASAQATAFGEDCIQADGSATFGAMQTDFTVRLPADDLTTEEAFGNWMAQVMEIVVQIPREELQGPNYGFVEFWFEKNTAEFHILRIPIQQYLNEAQGKTGEELFKYFQTAP
ncbi:MAG TPA: hypothetical protein PK152_05355 [Anaerolineales bacterium]|jgi:hypothetical protein|nr:hypothetical protein [Anaerolineae bacterium]HRJ55975.1 hypothetical protein [Anaerolineales bacterium]HRK88540.1 hypothetical protein [Anaerolineales bacterium]